MEKQVIRVRGEDRYLYFGAGLGMLTGCNVDRDWRQVVGMETSKLEGKTGNFPPLPTVRKAQVRRARELTQRI